VTNGQELTLGQPIIYVTPTTTGTNTVTLPTSDGLLGTQQHIILYVSGSATNQLGLTDGGNLVLGGDFVGSAGDVIALYGSADGWVELFRKDN
jgi:hypothetical protein